MKNSESKLAIFYLTTKENSRFTKNFAFLTVFILHSAFYISKAQTPFEFKHFQEKDGLSYNFIGGFLKDKDGLLWVATYEGLSFYDGQRFAYFTKNREGKNCISDNLIYDLTEDKDGDIWYATIKGVGHYNKKTNTFENFMQIEGVDIKIAYNIYCDRSGYIWFTCTNGLYCYHKSSKKFEVFAYTDVGPASKRLFYIRRNGIVEDPNKRGLWLTSALGLVYFDITAKQFYHAFNNPQQLPIFKEGFTSALALRGKNEIIYGSSNHELTIFDVKTFAIKQKIKLNSVKTPLTDKIATIFIDAEQNIWVGTWAYTLFFIDGKSWQIQEFSYDSKNPKSVIGNFFWGAYQDENQTVMLGTVNGISYTNPKRALYQVHNLAEKLPTLLQDDWISSFQEDADGWLVGTYASGLYWYNPLTKELRKLTKDFSIWNFIKHKQSVFMVGNNGILVYDFKTKTEKILSLPPNTNGLINSFNGVDAENDSTLWFVGDTKYIARYNLKSKTFDFFDLFKSFSGKTTSELGTELMIDKQKDIWIFTNSEGFFKFSKEKQQFLQVKQTEKIQFETFRVKSSFDKQNNFWIPNKGQGLYRFTPATARFVLWSKAEGLGSELCTGSISDNYGKIWTGGFNKISIFDTQTETFQNFYVSASEYNNDYNNKLYKLQNGHIISTIKGNLVEFMPDNVKGKPLTQKPIISQVIIADHDVIYTSGKDAIELGVGQNNLTIAFGYLPMSLNTPYRFAFRLKGIDKDWRMNGNQSIANYSNLEGGEYVFEVKAIDGNFESPVAQLRLYIDSPFYKTLWFRVLSFLAAVFLLIVFFRNRAIQKQKIHHLQLQSTRLEKDKTEIQYQNLINHLNPHFLFNSLTSLNSLIITEPKTASKFLQKLSAIYRYILQSKDKEIVTLEHELNFVKNYIDLQKSRFEDGLDIKINVEDDDLGLSIVPVTLQNLFENAIKHNTIEDEKPLIIEVFVEGDYLIVKNNLQKKGFVETSNRQGLDSLKTLYSYLSDRPFETLETEKDFIVKVPLL